MSHCVKVLRKQQDCGLVSEETHQIAYQSRAGPRALHLFSQH
jgi:hypothetical protein